MPCWASPRTPSWTIPSSVGNAVTRPSAWRKGSRARSAGRRLGRRHPDPTRRRLLAAVGGGAEGRRIGARRVVGEERARGVHAQPAPTAAEIPLVGAVVEEAEARRGVELDGTSAFGWRLAAQQPEHAVEGDGVAAHRARPPAGHGEDLAGG